MAKAMTFVGLDVHALQTHAAVLDPATGELEVRKLRIALEEVVAFLERLGRPVRAVYEAGPTGFGLARTARERSIDVQVAAPGSIPKGADDRVKTDRRDAVRLARLLAAGELRFAFVPSLADERFRDLVRSIDDLRGDLICARHRLGKFLLRRGERYPGPTRAWTGTHLRWLRALRFDDPCSQATFVDYLAAVELLLGRRASLLESLEQAIPASSHQPVIARLRCFRGIDTLSAAGLAAEAEPALRLPRHRPQRAHLRPQGPPRLDHQGRPAARAQAAGRGRPPLPSPAPHRRPARPPPARPRRTRDRDRLARAAAAAPTLATPTRAATQTGRRRRDRVRTRARRIPLGGRNPRLTPPPRPSV
jgi:transposase